MNSDGRPTIVWSHCSPNYLSKQPWLQTIAAAMVDDGYEFNLTYSANYSSSYGHPTMAINVILHTLQVKVVAMVGRPW